MLLIHEQKHMYGKGKKMHMPKQLQRFMAAWKAGAEGLSVLLTSCLTHKYAWEMCVCVRVERDKNKGFGQREVGRYGWKDDGEMAECRKGLRSVKAGQKGGRDEGMDVVRVPRRRSAFRKHVML